MSPYLHRHCILSIFKMSPGNSLAVQCLGLSAFTVVVRVQSLVRELRSCKPRKKSPNLVGELYLTVVLICISLITGEVEHDHSLL